MFRPTSRHCFPLFTSPRQEKRASEISFFPTAFVDWFCWCCRLSCWTQRQIFLRSRSRPQTATKQSEGVYRVSVLVTSDRCQTDGKVNIGGHRSKWEENNRKKRPTSARAWVVSRWSNICSGTLFGCWRDENLSLENSSVLDEDVDSIRLGVCVVSERTWVDRRIEGTNCKRRICLIERRNACNTVDCSLEIGKLKAFAHENDT